MWASGHELTLTLGGGIAQDYYDYVASIITSEPKIQFSDNMAMQFGFIADLEGYYHTNEEFNDFDDWFHSYTDRARFLTVNFETWPTDNFYGYFELSLGNSLGYDAGSPGGNARYRNRFDLSVPILNRILNKEGDALGDFDWSFPHNSFASAGGDHWNLMAGRTRLSWGAGETGNLMLSDSFPRHTLIRFNTFFDSFKYSIVGTMYPLSDSDQDDSLDGYKAMITHRLEFGLLKDKLSLVVNEACMFWSTSGQQFNLAQINPFGFMHNEYIRRNANSLLVFEADYTPVKGLNIYAQFALDEFSGPGEGRTNPAAKGILAGVKGAVAAGRGILTGSFEFAETDPFLYIRGLHYEDPTSGYGYDAVYRVFNAHITGVRMFTTYSLGNDVIVFDGKLGYQVPGKFKVGFEAMYLQHGSMNVNSLWGMYCKWDTADYRNAPDVSTPTTFDPFDTNDYDPNNKTITSTKAVEKTLALSVTGEYQILKCLSASLAADFLFVNNMDNVAGNDQIDVQITAGIKYSI